MEDTILKEHFISHIREKDFPCVMAKSALLSNNIHIIMANNLCPAATQVHCVLDAMYEEIDAINHMPGGNHSIALLFRNPIISGEEEYEALFWPYLQSLHDEDSKYYGWDKNVSPDPASKDFSFSLKGQAFYVIGMHNKSSRKARTLDRPAIIFNPHHQFEALRAQGNYNKIRDNIRMRDIHYSGTQNPMLKDFGEESEVFQYTGKEIDKETWICPFKP